MVVEPNNDDDEEEETNTYLDIYYQSPNHSVETDANNVEQPILELSRHNDELLFGSLFIIGGPIKGKKNGSKADRRAGGGSTALHHRNRVKSNLEELNHICTATDGGEFRFCGN
ncbi:unnamed protein product [Lactuca virosa]|uniref:Uncharacterized protein n=1 Tax=Lactuca virosa TaxID=75947 RepID=A0AAU9P960_9ASTR|nr:unnamed protein product [Lactuca virosa]